jgi:hypothetical protein
MFGLGSSAPGALVFLNVGLRLNREIILRPPVSDTIPPIVGPGRVPFAEEAWHYELAKCQAFQSRNANLANI